jgi:TolA-binding protein
MRLLPIGTVAIRTLAIRSLVLAIVLLTAWPAAAQLTREELALRNQIYELQQQVQALQQQVSNQGGGGGTYLGRPGYSGSQGGGGNDVVPQLLARVQTLEEEMRTLRGRVDQAENALQQQGADLGKRIDDLKFQMQNGQAGGAPAEAAPPAGPDSSTGYPGNGYPGNGYPGNGLPQTSGPGAPIPPQPSQTLSPPPGALGTTMVPPGAPPGLPPAQPPSPPTRRTPELALQDGNVALARRDYPAAEAAAHEVLNNFRTSPRAYEAQFLLAQALAGERQFSQAAIAYDDTYNRNRKGSRAPDALVGLANSLTAINEKRAACDTLAKLHTEFPQERPELRDTAASVAQRAGCH